MSERELLLKDLEGLSIDEKIEKVKNRIFFLEMKDHWDDKDFITSNIMNDVLRGLIKEKNDDEKRIEPSVLS